MQVGAIYSHLNGEEYMMVHHSDLLNIIRQGRAVPAVPLVLIGIVP